MTDTIDYRPYGLTGDPYVNRELDPRHEPDRRLLLHLDVLPSQAEVEEHIARTVHGGGSTAFLLSGRAGAGRTTLAHRIFHHYRGMLGAEEVLQLVHYKQIDHDSLARVNMIIKAVRNAVIRCHRRRRDELMESIPDSDDGPPDSLALQARADFIAHVTQDVKPRMRIALLVDGVQDDRFMDALALAFQYVPAVVVVTRDAYNTADTASAERLAERREWQRWARHLHLAPLGGSDVERIATNRWHVAAGDVECPFELAGVRSTFDRRQDPAAQAIKWLGWLLKGRLRGYEGSERWPVATELRLPAKWIEDAVRWAEDAPRSGGADHEAPW